MKKSIHGSTKDTRERENSIAYLFQKNNMNEKQ